jgi:hypothetical protein
VNKIIYHNIILHRVEGAHLMRTLSHDVDGIGALRARVLRGGAHHAEVL